MLIWSEWCEHRRKNNEAEWESRVQHTEHRKKGLTWRRDEIEAYRPGGNNRVGREGNCSLPAPKSSSVLSLCNNDASLELPSFIFIQVFIQVCNKCQQCYHFYSKRKCRFSQITKLIVNVHGGHWTKNKTVRVRLWDTSSQSLFLLIHLWRQSSINRLT
jgi:hypothetical protein